MTTNPRLFSHLATSAGRQQLAVWAVAWVCCFLVWGVTPSAARDPNIHYLQSGDSPPGAIGHWQLQRGGPLPGYFQPVEISVPEGAEISLAVEGNFDPGHGPERLTGFLVGQVYRVRITNIPLHPGLEVYPTVEIINRLYPPPGREWDFPIQIDLTTEELLLASQGHLVTRVIYLEDPNQALPSRQIEGRQSWFEAEADDDPLQVADRLGRPMAILRMGSIVPEQGAPSAHFLYGSPPLLLPVGQNP